jgi:hypothetical protein
MPDPINSARRSEGEPHDRLTRLCALMTDALDAHPGTEDVKAVVMLQDAEKGGIQTWPGVNLQQEPGGNHWSAGRNGMVSGGATPREALDNLRVLEATASSQESSR